MGTFITYKNDPQTPQGGPHIETYHILCSYPTNIGREGQGTLPPIPPSAMRPPIRNNTKSIQSTHPSELDPLHQHHYSAYDQEYPY